MPCADADPARSCWSRRCRSPRAPPRSRSTSRARPPAPGRVAPGACRAPDARRAFPRRSSRPAPRAPPPIRKRPPAGCFLPDHHPDRAADADPGRRSSRPRCPRRSPSAPCRPPAPAPDRLRLVAPPIIIHPRSTSRPYAALSKHCALPAPLLRLPPIMRSIAAISRNTRPCRPACAFRCRRSFDPPARAQRPAPPSRRLVAPHQRPAAVVPSDAPRAREQARAPDPSSPPPHPARPSSPPPLSARA